MQTVHDRNIYRASPSLAVMSTSKRLSGVGESLKDSKIGIGAGLGAGFGAALGVAMNDLEVGLGVGVALGLAFGAFLNARQ